MLHFLLGVVLHAIPVVVYAATETPTTTRPASGISGNPLDASGHMFDYIIVGGGLTGLTLAARLSEDARSTVLVIEVGSDNRRDPRVYDVYNYEQVYKTEIDWAWPVEYDKTLHGGKTLGGGSSINTVMWTRGATAQYDAWSDLLTPGERTLGWNWNSLYPYMKKAEHYHSPSSDNRRLGADGVPSWHGTRGPVHVAFPQEMIDGPQHPAFIAAIQNVTGITHCRDLNGGDPNCVAFVPGTVNPDDDFHRSSSAMAYLTPVENTRNNWLTLVNSTVSKLVWKADGSKTVVGVEFVHLNDPSTKYRANVRKEVIMAAGTINTPTILQRSGVGDPAHLSSLGISAILNLPTVGKNLQEQTRCSMAWNTTGFPLGGKPLSDLLALPNLSQLFGKNATAFGAKIRSSLDTWAGSQKQDALSKVALKTIYQTQADVIIKDKVPVVEILYSDYVQGVHAIPFLAISPFSRGSVKITTTDPFTKPNVTTNVFSAPFDVEVQAQTGRLLRQLFKTPPLSNITTAEFFPGSSLPDDAPAEAWGSFFKATFWPNSHPVGTCSMMRKELGGVVDGHLRVYGARNLRVTDASVMPIAVAAHTMSTLYGIAEKLADMIKAGL